MTAGEFLSLWNDSNDFILCRTSGSTGTPKMIKLTKADMRRSARATINFFGMAPGARYVCPIPFDYIGGRMMAVRSIVGDGQLVEISPSNNFEFTGFADLIAIVPSQIDALTDESVSARLRNVIIGGAPMSDSMRSTIVEARINAWQTYGMTETASHVALAKVTMDKPVYQALPGISFSTDDRNCLIIERPGYDTSTLVTNDVIELLSPTTFKWLGRADNVINSGGVKINAEQLEEEISRLFPELAEHFLIRKRPDSKWGEVPEIVIERGFIPDNLTQTLLSSLDPKVCPRHVIEVPSLPRTANGKLRRR